MSLRTYYMEKKMRDGLVGLFCSGYRDVWTRGVKRGEPRRCMVTGSTIKSGEAAWRPITNRNNRMDRISDGGMKQLEAIHKSQLRHRKGEERL